MVSLIYYCRLLTRTLLLVLVVSHYAAVAAAVLLVHLSPFGGLTPDLAGRLSKFSHSLIVTAQHCMLAQGPIHINGAGQYDCFQAALALFNALVHTQITFAHLPSCNRLETVMRV